MSNVVREWILRFSRASELAGQGDTSAVAVVAALLTIDISDPLVSTLQNALLDRNVDITAAVNSARLGETSLPPWRALAPLARAYLEFCRDVDPNNLAGCFDSFGGFMAALQSAYTHPRGAALNGALRAAAKVAAKQYSRRCEESRWLAATLLRVYNSICSDKVSAGAVKKRDVLLFVAVMQCRLHFRAQQPAQCASVFAGLHAVAGALSSYAMSEQVEFRFWLGRFLLLRGESVLAFRHLLWAYERCYYRTSNRARILRWLAVPAVLVGRPPRLEALAARIGPEATLRIAKIRAAMEEPSMFALKHLLAEPWVAQLRLSACLLEAGRQLIARRATWKLLQIQDPQGRLPLENTRAAFWIAGLLDPTDDDENCVRTEGLCGELCQRGMLKAKIFPAARMLSMPKQNPMPHLIEVTGALTEEYGFNDSWMLQ